MFSARSQRPRHLDQYSHGNLTGKPRIQHVKLSDCRIATERKCSLDLKILRRVSFLKPRSQETWSRANVCGLQTTSSPDLASNSTCSHSSRACFEIVVDTNLDTNLYRCLAKVSICSNVFQCVSIWPTALGLPLCTGDSYVDSAPVANEARGILYVRSDRAYHDNLQKFVSQFCSGNCCRKHKCRGKWR